MFKMHYKLLKVDDKGNPIETFYSEVLEFEGEYPTTKEDDTKITEMFRKALPNYDELIKDKHYAIYRKRIAENTIFKYLDLSDWTFEVNCIPPELNECLERKLIKRADTDNFQFVVLEENLEEVKNTLGEDYNRVSEYSFIEWVEQELVEHSQSIEVENYDLDKIEVTGQEMFEIISEDFDSYIDGLNKSEIYEADKPIAKFC